MKKQNHLMIVQIINTLGSSLVVIVFNILAYF